MNESIGLAAATLNTQHILQNPFIFSDHDVRTAVDGDGEVWFCAKDVFKALEIKWCNRAGSLSNMPEEWVCPLQLQGQRGVGEVIFIAEPAMYRVLFRSNEPASIEFANWVCAEVLPNIDTERAV